MKKRKFMVELELEVAYYNVPEDCQEVIYTRLGAVKVSFLRENGAFLFTDKGDINEVKITKMEAKND